MVITYEKNPRFAHNAINKLIAGVYFENELRTTVKHFEISQAYQEL